MTNYIIGFFILLFITFVYIILYFKNRLFDDVHKTINNVERTQNIMKETQNTIKENQAQLIKMLENILNKENSIENDIQKINKKE